MLKIKARRLRTGILIILLVAQPAFAVSLKLTWQDNAASELGYRIERCEGLGCSNFAWLGGFNLPPNTQFYEDKTVVNGQFYNYRVLAFDTASNSPYSNIAGRLCCDPVVNQIPHSPVGVRGKQP
jgi:hypothetical protein